MTSFPNMKQRIYILLALAAAVACSKTDVVYDDALTGEITVSPVSGTITKAAITGAVYPEENHIALFAYHNPAQTPMNNVTDYSAFEANEYLKDAEFHYNEQTDKEGIIAWSGLESIYYWPITGSLVFAGYSLPAPATAGDPSASIGTVTYDLTDDHLKIAGYNQSVDTEKTFDLLYFGRDGNSYNKRREGTAVPITFNHALSWITIEVKGGTGSTMTGKEWAITEVKLLGVNTYADFEFQGTKAEPKVSWTVKDSDDSDSDIDAADMSIYSDATGRKLTTNYVNVEEETIDGEAVAKNGVVVIPQIAKVLEVKISYDSPAGDNITETVEIDLAKYTNDGWEAGKRYTYQLTFDPQQILVFPSVSAWPNPGETVIPNE